MGNFKNRWGAYLSFIITTAILACNSAKNEKVTEEKNENKIVDQDSITIALIDGEAQQQAVMKKGRHVVFSFDIKEHVKLHATVKADEPVGNVRIAQIFTPNNSADGPFGQEMEYDLKEPGSYRLVISENQMAGDPYNGPFTLHIKTSDR